MKQAKTIFAALAMAATLASCSNTDKKDNVTGDKDTAVLKSDNKPPAATNPDNAAAANRWNDVDWNSPVVKYDEVTSKDVEVRGNDRYSIYSLGEDVLFETGKADIKKGAENNLSNVVSSINKHFNGGYVKVYGFTDSKGSADANNTLSAQRAQAVAGWLTGNGKMAADHVSTFAEGEANPVASNATAAGRQANRRVTIVATGGGNK